jgi:RimJ/RimL family protein N-acetyltransferase
VTSSTTAQSQILLQEPDMTVKLSDGVILLRPLELTDAAAHLAGEDPLIARWLNGGISTLSTVRAYIARCDQDWRNDGPLRAFGIFECATQQLIGNIEANLAFFPEAGQVNVSYGVFRAWRGQGVASRALDLLAQYLAACTDARQLVLRVSPENASSLRVAQKSGFASLGSFDEHGAPTAYFQRSLR